MTNLSVFYLFMSFYRSACQSFYPRSWKAWLYVDQNHRQNHHGSKRTTSLQLPLQEPEAQRGTVCRWDAFPCLGWSLMSCLISCQFHNPLDLWLSYMNWRIQSAASCFRRMSRADRDAARRCLTFGTVLRAPGLSGDCKDPQGLCVPTQKSYSSSETLKAFDQHLDQTRLELGRLELWGAFHLERPGFNILTRNIRCRCNLPPKTKTTRDQDEQVHQASQGSWVATTSDWPKRGEKKWIKQKEKEVDKKVS